MCPHLYGCSTSSTNPVGKQEAWNGAPGSCYSSDPVPHTNTAQRALPRQSQSCQPLTGQECKAAHISCCSSWATAEHLTCPEQPQLHLLPATPSELHINIYHVAQNCGDIWEQKRRSLQKGSPTGVFLLQVLRVKPKSAGCAIIQPVCMQGKGRKRKLNYSSS